MIILNLTNKKTSEIKYEVFSFPDGQQDILLTNLNNYFELRNYGFGEVLRCDSVQIRSRFNNFKDLELILCATKVLRSYGVKEIHLYIPYLLGARSDRQFQQGGTSYLRDIIAPILNAQNYESVVCYDIHNYEMANACINNLKNITNGKFVGWAIRDILVNNSGINIIDTAIVVPDGGALKKIYETVKEANYEEDLIVAHKHRDPKTGELLSFQIPIEEKNINKALIWVDDLVDGGGSFIGEAIAANSNGHKGKKFLVCTHGIFSKGFEELEKYFDGIYCTDSYANFSNLSYTIGYKSRKFKQYNII